MAYLLHELYDWYTDAMINRSDPRVKDWPMMQSPLPTFALCVFYAYFSKSLGPKIMANRKPLDLRNILIVYNCIQTIFSAWIFYEYLQSGWLGEYSFKCQPVDYSDRPIALRMARTCWWYYIAKFTEFFDTLFFVLRKKNEQASTLHVIHHGCMPMSVWLGLKFAPGGHSTFFAMLNSFVHIVMYAYYMVAAMGPKYQKYIWWKKYLTSFQMVQFVAIFAHQLQLLFRECNYPKAIMLWIALHGVMFLFLFTDFYKVKYAKRDGAKSAQFVTQNGGNKGLCMPVLSDETSSKPKQNGVHTNGHANGISNGYADKKTANGSVVLNGGGSNGVRARKIQ